MVARIRMRTRMQTHTHPPYKHGEGELYNSEQLDEDYFRKAIIFAMAVCVGGGEADSRDGDDLWAILREADSGILQVTIYLYNRQLVLYSDGIYCSLLIIVILISSTGSRTSNDR